LDHVELESLSRQSAVAQSIDEVMMRIVVPGLLDVFAIQEVVDEVASVLWSARLSSLSRRFFAYWENGRLCSAWKWLRGPEPLPSPGLVRIAASTY